MKTTTRDMVAVLEMARECNEPGLNTMAELRGYFADFDKARFDAAMLGLSREGAIVLHYSDMAPAWVSAAQRALWVADGETLYCGWALRS